MSEWLPIATAPKDGTHILVYPALAASSPCPECVKRRRAIALIDHRFAKGVAE